MRMRAHWKPRKCALSGALGRLPRKGAFVTEAAAKDHHNKYWFYWLGLENSRGIP